MWYVILASMGVLMLHMFASTVSRLGSPLRSSVAHYPTMLIYGLFVVMFAMNANADVDDRMFYTRDLERASFVTLGQAFDPDVFASNAGDDPLYIALIWMLSRIGVSTTAFFAGVAIICLCVYLGTLSRVLDTWQVAYVFILTVSFGVFTAYTSIAARQGLSMTVLFAGILVVALASRHVLGVLLMVLACLFHWSALPFVVVVLAILYRKPSLRLVLVAWSFCSVLFVLNVQERFLGPLVGLIPKYSGYTSGDLATSYLGGTNRLDFLAASALVGAVMLIMRRALVLPEWYDVLVKVYWGMNAVFVLMGYVYFSDRLAAFSWFLAPFLLSAPVFAKESSRARNLSGVVLACACLVAVAVGPVRDIPFSG